MNRAEYPSATSKRGNEQIHPDLAARMEQAEARRQEADFASILESLPEEGLDLLSGAVPETVPSPGETVARDRNLSSVIQRIRDEGPADAPGEGLAEDRLTLTGAAAPAEERKEPETETADTGGPTGESPAGSGFVVLEKPAGQGGMRLFLVLLLCLSGAMGFLLYQQGERGARLEQELAGLRESVAVLGRQQQDLARRIDGLPGTVPAKETEARLERLVTDRLEQARRERAALDLVALAMADGVRSPDGTASPAAKPETGGTVAAKGARTTKKEGSTPAAEGRAKPAKAPAAAGGKWAVFLLSSSSRKQAEQALARLRKSEPRAEIRVAKVKGRTVYRVTVAGFSSRQAALDYRGRAIRKLGARGAWVGRT